MSNPKDQRASFPLGEQRAFLEAVQNVFSILEIAAICGCSARTVRDWRREKFTMPLEAVYRLSFQSGIPIPSLIRIIPAFAHTSAAGRKGYAAVIEKYGSIPNDPAHRISQWRKWWAEEGQHVSNFPNRPIPIHLPERNAELAEFVGIAMGDGGLSKHQCTISLNTVDDAEYIVYVTELIQNLFHVTPGVYPRKSQMVTDIVLSRSLAVTYLHGLGLPIGDKIHQNLNIPEWIFENESFLKACIRGLIDTDGCIFTHRYKVKGKWYSYKKLSFTSASPLLIQSVFKAFEQFGFTPHISAKGRDVRLESKKDVQGYFELIGSSNAKHLRRYEK